jgi:hypothetical protein
MLLANEEGVSGEAAQAAEGHKGAKGHIYGCSRGILLCPLAIHENNKWLGAMWED